MLTQIKHNMISRQPLNGGSSLQCSDVFTAWNNIQEYRKQNRSIS
jgi:hypothetical protein